MTAPVVSLSSNGPNVVYFLPFSSSTFMFPVAVLKLTTVVKVGVSSEEKEERRMFNPLLQGQGVGIC